MDSLTEYITAISKRGDAYGGHGGVLDLLYWCGVDGTQEVTLEDAKRFYEDPLQPYAKTEQAIAKTQSTAE
jgi:hypothetical protein